MKEKDYNYANELVKDARQPYRQNRKAGKFSLQKMIMKQRHTNILASNGVKGLEENEGSEASPIVSRQ